ncbi:MAG: phosphatidylinositol-specific phospholipase C domain-containing protein [Methanocellales archaeon]|nr:phosphatidylinositol-specific phospholipase C domain-containing protein [Methanocellales archaeon]MDD3291787.1 phosphatidylinositol-specific phospholipase C domain-containing protein [Methanocellales archaeon]MDD5235137.1 phosphatidylinositol-specific phospholipase C domain-containing protein [Methanocellales archaeon]MDD5485275.1 phosphatidylinositol-specific phospholipase C domain-containing protein [Methanocellales archaeon]
MGRNATINIANETGYALSYVSHNIEHGKFNEDPPSNIGVGETKTFKVGNKTGAKIGPKGSVTYRLNLTSEISVDLVFYWDHPFGHTSSSYEMGSIPDWFSSYYLDPSNPTGHDQTVTFHTRLNDYGFDPKNWMSNLQGSTNLRKIVIPGSHDSGTYEITPSSYLCLDADNQILVFASNVGIASQWAKAQSNSILSQLNSGRRYFDIRISDGYYSGLVIKDLSINNVVGSPIVCHSVGVTPPSSILDDIKQFISSNPKEIIILNFQHFYHKQEDATDFYNDLITQIKSKLGSKIIERSTFGEKIENLTLQRLWDNGSQVLILFDKDHKVEKTLSPEDGTIFKDAYETIYNNETAIWSANDFMSNIWPKASSTDALKTKLKDIVSNEMPGTDKLFVLQGVVTPNNNMYLNAISGGLPKSLEELGNQVTPNVESWVVNDWVDKDLNIIMCDWVSNSIITQLCYLINKKRKLSPVAND